MKNEPILSVENLAVSFDTYGGEIEAVRGVSWHVNKKETISIVGESGCGKTISIQTVLGLNPKGIGRIKSGEVIFENKDLLKATSKEMRSLQGNKMSIIFQDPFTYLNPTLTVGDQITEVYLKHNRVRKKEAEDRMIEIMNLISIPNPELTVKRYPHQLSGGMRQRIMITMALICDPKILFADEPTTALDVTVQAQIIELMNSLKEKIDTSIVLITHDMGVVANMAERVYVMYAGKIVEHGDVNAIFYNPKHPYTQGLLKSVPRIDGSPQDGLYSIPGTPTKLVGLPKGCAFAARCPHAMNICERLMPDYISFEEPVHYAACWYNHPACSKGR